jgi:hypothetical protein
MTEPRSWTIVVPTHPTSLPNANRHKHPMQLYRLGRQVQDDVTWLLRLCKVPKLGRARIVCTVLLTTARRMDPANWAPTAKAAVDAIVKEGVLPDDGHKYLEGPDMRVRVNQPHAGLEITITELGGAGSPGTRGQRGS